MKQKLAELLDFVVLLSCNGRVQKEMGENIFSFKSLSFHDFCGSRGDYLAIFPSNYSPSFENWAGFQGKTQVENENTMDFEV